MRDLNSVSGEEKRECVAAKSRHVSVRRGPANEFTQSGPLRRALDWRACGVDRVCIRGEHNQPGQIPPGQRPGSPGEGPQLIISFQHKDQYFTTLQ